MTNLSNQVMLDRLAAAFGFQSAEHVGEYVRGLVESRFAEEEFQATLKMMLAPSIQEDAPVPDHWQMYYFVSDIRVEGSNISFAHMLPVTRDEKELMVALDALEEYITTIQTGAELLNTVFDPATLPVPCNRVQVEASVVQLAAYGSQRYVRNTVTNVVRPTGVPFAPLTILSKTETPVAPTPEPGMGTVLPMVPRKK